MLHCPCSLRGATSTPSPFVPQRALDTLPNDYHYSDDCDGHDYSDDYVGYDNSDQYDDLGDLTTMVIVKGDFINHPYD